MPAFPSAMQQRFRGGAAGIYAASARSGTFEFAGWADCVEKLENSNIAIFRQKPITTRSQIRSFFRRGELAYGRWEVNLADPPRCQKLVALYVEKFRRSDPKTEFFNMA
tara:strand:+ start:286 stop:612 length:327 start_codon:yes stop_codon:yes gene_type:complete